MISITLDLGNVPSVLAALADRRNGQLVANAAAESFVDDTLDWIKAGKGFTPRHGGAGLEGAISWHGNGDGSATILAQKDYAGFVEYGTKPHVIGAKPGRFGLKIRVPGIGYIIGRSIKHPGSKPYPFFFADLADRQQHMLERALSVLAAKMAQAGGR